MDTGLGGLSGSRFAPQNSGYTYGTGYSRRGGAQGTTPNLDWDCSSCGFSNFGWRRECFRCDKIKGWIPIEGSVDLQSNNENRNPGLDGNPHGRGKGSSFFGLSNGLSNGNNGRSASSTPVVIEERIEGGSGSENEPRGALAMSMWAPRNRTASQKYGDKPWTRVSSLLQPSIPLLTLPRVSGNAHPPSQAPSSRPPTPPDLGLPYEVQHFILGMMQRILEDACWDLASRWIPAELRERNWSCSEAVELSVWKKFLPSAIPYNAINPVLSYSLEMGLADAVRIRNSAVHRHLYDNREIRILAYKAGNLMEMFRDLSRKEKFDRLRSELERWDEGCRINRDVARTALEEALKSIGERPIDDMDWTPNAVSMQEIKDDGVGDAQHQAESVVYSDEMELD